MPSEQELIELWRYERLRQLGFGSPVAVRLANDPYCDIHLAEKMVAGGCSFELAERILSSLPP